MKEKTFEFLVQIINSKQIGEIFKRADVIKMLIAYYKPSIYSKSQSTIRSTPSIILKCLVDKKYIERTEIGTYRILKHISIDIKYKDLCITYIKNNNARERKSNRKKVS